MKKILRLVAASLGMLALLGSINAPLCHAQANDGLLITPLNHTIQGRPGSKTTIEFKISNFLKTRNTIEVGLHDLTQDASGAPILGDPGSTPHSASPWISVTQGKISVAPQQTQVIRATVAIPPAVSGSYHSAITLQLFTGDTPTTPGSSAAVVNQAILPIHVFIPGTLKPAVELEGASLKPAAGNIASMASEEALKGKWVLVPRVENTGNSMVRIRGDIIITSQKGELVGRYQVSGGDPDGQAILPGATVSFPIFINSTLPDDQYPARISLRFQGAKRMEGYSAPMTLKPRSEGSTPDAPKGEVALGTIERTGLQALVEPRVIIGNVQPNSVKTQRITVTNLEDFPVSVAATASGLSIDTDGETIALPDAVTATWMTIAPANFRLGPQQSRVISVRMNAPSDENDRWGLLQFAFSSATANASTLTANARTTVLLRNMANPAEGEAKAENVALTRSATGPIVSVTINNPQTRPLAFAASALQLTPEAPSPDAPKTEGAAPEAPAPISIKGESDIVLLPGASRRLDFELPSNVAPVVYNGVLKLSGLAASNGAKATGDFTLPFNLSLLAPKAPSPAPDKAVAPKAATPKTAP